MTPRMSRGERATNFRYVKSVARAREVAAGGMADDKNLARIAAVFFDVSAGPAEGVGHVFDVFGVANARRQAVIGEHDDVAALGEIAGDGSVAEDVEDIILAAGDPTAAVQEEQHRSIVLPLGAIDIELMPITVRIRGMAR